MEQTDGPCSAEKPAANEPLPRFTSSRMSPCSYKSMLRAGWCSVREKPNAWNSRSSRSGSGATNSMKSMP